MRSGKELLPLLGIRGTVRRIAPTEQVYLHLKDLFEDFNYEMEDGTWSEGGNRNDNPWRNDPAGWN